MKANHGESGVTPMAADGIVVVYLKEGKPDMSLLLVGGGFWMGQTVDQVIAEYQRAKDSTILAVYKVEKVYPVDSP